MKSDVIHVTNEGTGVDEALRQAEAVAAYKGLPRKSGIQLRLLTEEMMGMLLALTGQREAEFWIDDTDKAFKLHLKTETLVNTQMRSKLLSVSTSGRNVSAKGVMGRIRDLFERALEPADDRPDAAMISAAAYGWNYAGSPVNSDVAGAGIWSFNRYRSALESGNGPKEEWDELEKSIVANIADEIEVGIKDSTVEMIIYKKF